MLKTFFDSLGTSGPRGGGGILVLFVGYGDVPFFRGTFSNHYGIMGIIFTIL